jgi:hypothetical protein
MIACVHRPHRQRTYFPPAHAAGSKAVIHPDDRFNLKEHEDGKIFSGLDSGRAGLGSGDYLFPFLARGFQAGKHRIIRPA